MAEAVDSVVLSLQMALAGRYSLERELGRGGMGIVYLVHEVSLDRPVALKLLPPPLAAHQPLRERFLREARTAGKLSHPNIIPIHAVDEVGDFVFYVMAYVEGETLAQRIGTRGPLSPAEATRIMREVAWALAYAHAQGVVHRDIKPENILLEAGTGRALVADFGIARLAQTTGTTGVGEVLGTPEFMSPEQASGGVVDGRSDLYSLGVVAYLALTGRLPFRGENAAAILARHLTQVAPPVASIAPAVPARLATAVDRCLAKEPRDRFQGAEALAEELGSTLDPKPDVPVKVRVLVKQWKWAPAISVILGAQIGVQFGSWAIAGLLTLSCLLFGFGYPLRRLRKLGYRQADVVNWLELVTRRQEEEFVSTQPRVRTRHQVVTWWVVTRGSMFLFFLSFLWQAHDIPWDSPATVSASDFTSLLVNGLVTLGAVAGVESMPQAPLWWLVRLSRSQLASWLFNVVGVGLKQGPVPSSVHRPTELAIGLAADALFRALPNEDQRALAELPDILRRLESRAEALRSRREELQDMLARAGEGPPRREIAPRKDALVADLSAARDAAQQRLGEVVTALETIRLDLLRLRGGVGTVAAITADMAAARQVGDQIDRLLQGQREVEQVMEHTE